VIVACYNPKDQNLHSKKFSELNGTMPEAQQDGLFDVKLRRLMCYDLYKNLYRLL
jgi:hypothetical protein